MYSSKMVSAIIYEYTNSVRLIILKICLARIWISSPKILNNTSEELGGAIYIISSKQIDMKNS